MLISCLLSLSLTLTSCSFSTHDPTRLSMSSLALSCAVSAQVARLNKVIQLVHPCCIRGTCFVQQVLKQTHQ